MRILRTVLIIARLTILETARRRVLGVALILSLAFLTFYAVGFSATLRHTEVAPLPTREWKETAPNMLTMLGMYSLNLMSVMLMAFISVDTLAGEIASGAIQAILTKPVRRSEIVLGKWLGFAILGTLYLVLMLGGLMAAVRLISGYAPPNLLRGASLIWLNGLLMLGLSFAGGTRLQTLANGTFLFGLLALALLGNWMEQVGVVLGDTTATQVGTFMSLLFPGEALWQRAAYEMRPPGMLGFSPLFPLQSIPSPLMIGYAIFYTFAALVLSLHWFSRRDV